MDKSLSAKERLIIANQFRILALLSREDEDQKKYYENMRDIFVEGYSRYYSLATEGFSEEVSYEECTFVIDVLALYRDLYFSWINNEDAKKIIKESDVLFKGFDLNDEKEAKYFGFYKFLVERLGDFEVIKELIQAGKIKDYNSHGSGPNMNKLKRMISKRKEILNRQRYSGYQYLSATEIQEILNVNY